MKCELCGGKKMWCRGPLGPDSSLHKRTSGKKRGRRSDSFDPYEGSAKKGKDKEGLAIMADARSSTHDWDGLGEFEDEEWEVDSESTFSTLSMNGMAESLPTLRIAKGGHIPQCSSDCCGTVWQEIVKVLDSRGEDAECTVGRLAENDIIFLQDPLVSRVHAKIVRSGSCFFLQDLQSSNGTVISDSKMKPNEIQSLQARDVIVMGKSFFHVMDGSLY